MELRFFLPSGASNAKTCERTKAPKPATVNDYDPVTEARYCSSGTQACSHGARASNPTALSTQFSYGGHEHVLTACTLRHLLRPERCNLRRTMPMTLQQVCDNGAVEPGRVLMARMQSSKCAIRATLVRWAMSVLRRHLRTRATCIVCAALGRGGHCRALMASARATSTALTRWAA